MRTIAVMQPTYLPWLGYFELIAQSDAFVIYDSVQFEKQSWQQRNRIRNEKGDILLTVPVKHGAGLSRKISDVEIFYNSIFPQKHLDEIRKNYSGMPGADVLLEELETIFASNPVRLADLNVRLIRLGMQHLGIETPLQLASELDVQGTKVEALVDICRKMKADHYYSPAGSKTYIDENNIFESNGIRLSYQQYDHPVYRQMNYPDFISHLAFIDLLFNAGDAAGTIFRSTIKKIS